jgi:rhodanese-related sulfurtransferase
MSMAIAKTGLPARGYDSVRASLLNREEIAFLDVREEDPHAQGHPLFAANLPLSRLELDAYTKLPRRSVPIVTFDNGEGFAELAAQRLRQLGYSHVAVFEGGLEGWKAAGGEVFIDVNVPSKAFGELVEAERHTPSLSAGEVKALIESGADAVIIDARRYDEFQAMSIPKAASVPGAELVLRVPALAPSPKTLVIVNCAGRTRSIIGAQSLINAGLPNPIAALRNGTIGWTLAGQALESGQTRRFPEVDDGTAAQAASRARALADRAGVKRATAADIARWRAQDGRTTYFFDVRTTEEYETAHLPGFRSVPGGQLVQETEMAAPVRGARIILVDGEGVRANMTASWLAQMAWEVYALDGGSPQDLIETGPWEPPLPQVPSVPSVTPAELAQWLSGEVPPAVIDLTSFANYRRGHVPGAWFAIRSDLKNAIGKLPHARRIVLTCETGLLASFAASDFAALTRAEIFVLGGGTAAWKNAGFKLEAGEGRPASPPTDRYRRPYEGTGNAREAMQAYLDWEFGLVAQLARDGTHHFRVI